MNFQARTLGKISTVCTLALILSTMLVAKPRASMPDKMTPEEVVAKHLESIGTAEARAKIKSHIILGTAVATVRIAGAGSSGGGSVLASQGTRSLISISYNNQEYPFERVGFDGKTVTVGDVRPGLHSVLGNFFMHHEMPLKEGLLAGTLSTSWPLLDMSARSAKLKYAGTKTLGGRKVHVLEYEPENSTGLKTTLYFDAETFRHVHTEYEQRIAQQMENSPDIIQQQGDAITKLTEDFSDFKAEGGLTLPHTYKLQLSIESLHYRTLQDWVFTLATFNFNHQIDDSQFNVRTTGGKS